MSKSRKNKEQANTGGKKPYVPPQIIGRELLESVAAVCSGAGSKEDTNSPNSLGGLCGAGGFPLSS